jgi:hypothetical protein
MDSGALPVEQKGTDAAHFPGAPYLLLNEAAG